MSDICIRLGVCLVENSHNSSLLKSSSPSLSPSWSSLHDLIDLSILYNPPKFYNLSLHNTVPISLISTTMKRLHSCFRAVLMTATMIFVFFFLALQGNFPISIMGATASLTAASSDAGPALQDLVDCDTTSEAHILFSEVYYDVLSGMLLINVEREGAKIIACPVTNV
jgi:hypothetical protein